MNLTIKACKCGTFTENKNGLCNYCNNMRKAFEDVVKTN